MESSTPLLMDLIEIKSREEEGVDVTLCEREKESAHS